MTDEPPKAPETGPDGAAAGTVTKERVMEALNQVRDSEINQTLVDLGLIYGVDVAEDGKRVVVRMTLTTPYCPYGPQMLEAVRKAVVDIPGVAECEVKLVWDPPWDPRTMASDEVREILGFQ